MTRFKKILITFAWICLMASPAYAPSLTVVNAIR